MLGWFICPVVSGVEKTLIESLRVSTISSPKKHSRLGADTSSFSSLFLHKVSARES